MAHPGVTNPLFSRLALKILAIVVLCGVLPVALAGGYLLRHSEEVQAQRVRDVLVTQAQRRSAAIDAWVGARLRDTARWAATLAVLQAAPSAEGEEPGRARLEARDYLVTALGRRQVYESLSVVGPRGEVLASTRAEQLEVWARPLLAADANDEPGLASPIRRSDELVRPTLLILHPVVRRSGAETAHLVARVDLRELETLLGAPEDESPLSFWLLDDAARVVGHSGRIVDNPGEVALERAFQNSAPGRVSEGDLPGLGRVLFASHPLAAPLHGRLVAVTSPITASGPLGKSRSRLLTLAVVAGVVMLFAFTWAIRGVLGPILLLSEGARRLSGGDLNVYLPVRGRDEIAALTAAFNEMIRRVREGRQQTEEARDELAHANEGLRAANQTLETLAITDGLTGLYNHRHFQDTLEREVRRADREARPLGLLMLDIDHFKQFNDRWGHTEGDAALRRVASQVMKTIRASDSAFRYGGEELAVLLPGCGQGQARDVAEKIRTAVAASPLRRGRPGSRLTVSIGVASVPDDGHAARALVEAADAALYSAKAQGRNCVVAAGQPSTKPRPRPVSEPNPAAEAEQEEQTMQITVAHSPDSDDAFMFFGLASGAVADPQLSFAHILADIESLNREAQRGTYEVTALSVHAYPYVAERYALMTCGGSIGDGYGPLVVARESLDLADLAGRCIAVPGTLTTAFLALRLALPQVEHRVVPFDRIPEAVASGQADLGLLIHEAQLTYGALGLVALLDLGAWWKGQTGLPLPLGANAVRRDLGPERMRRVTQLVRDSVRHGLDHRDEALAYALSFARGMETRVADRFVGLWVNERTLDCGPDGRRAIQVLLDRGHAAGLIPRRVTVDFVEP